MIINSILYSCSQQTIWSVIRYFTQKFYIFEKFNSDFPYIEVWFTDQNSKPLKIEDKIKIALVINT